MISDSQILKATEALQAGRYSEVLEFIEWAPGGPDAPAVGLYLLGFALFKTKRFRESVACWERLANRAWPIGTATKIKVNLWSGAYMAPRAEGRAGGVEDAAGF